MNFILTNIKDNTLEVFKELHFKGSCVKVINDSLRICQSADWRYFNRFDDHLVEKDICSQIEFDDFFFTISYAPQICNNIIFQTDIVGYEYTYIYQKNGVFCITDDVLYMAKLLNRNNMRLELNEENVRLFLFYSECFFEDSIFFNVKRLPPAVIGEIDINGNIISTRIYDDFVMKGEYREPILAAKSALQSIDNYFIKHYSKDTTYGIGMSGGLDSRVGAYFAKKNCYSTVPFFIGIKNNKLGIKTNDVKRAYEVNDTLDLAPIQFVNPKTVPFDKKVEFDSLNAPYITTNIPQNSCKIEGVDVLINAMVGGEAFGALVTLDLDKMSLEELTNYIQNRLTNHFIRLGVVCYVD